MPYTECTSELTFRPKIDNKLTRFDMPVVKRRMNPRIRIAHLNLGADISTLQRTTLLFAYPTCPTRFWKAIGKIVPPMEDPQANMPKARPRRFLNQCDTTAIVGPKHTPQLSLKNMTT